MAYILIVEDNEMNRDMLGRRLERRGFEIQFALDGQEGLDSMRARKPDLVLMDIKLNFSNLYICIYIYIIWKIDVLIHLYI